MKSRIALATILLAFAGMALAKGLYLSRLTDDEMQSKVSASPIIELAGDATLDPLPDGAVVEACYQKFNPLNPPSPREHFAVAMGGIALVNVEREPILRKGSLAIHSADWTYDITGYAGYADVVVKK